LSACIHNTYMQTHTTPIRCALTVAERTAMADQILAKKREVYEEADIRAGEALNFYINVATDEQLTHDYNLWINGID